MSFAALAWAGKCQPGSPARKLVLFALADRYSDEDGLAWPSIAWLCEWTGLNRKTVITAISDMEEAGLISDSGERAGRTSQVKAYRLHIETVPKTEQSQKRNSSTFSRKQSQKRDTEPVREPKPLVSANADTSPNPKIEVSSETADKPLSISEVVDAWNETAGKFGMRRCAKLTEDRRKRLRSLINRYPVQDFQAAIAAAARSPFCRGENDRGWTADIDFFSRERNFVRLVEGSFDGKSAH